ncbi:hypothetical protein EDC01DRAFT_636044 [Geopyxis carbonaria]|nr:hypothetical protein EDC01DRAFT_636044 [Geopyxis carbonaria]
MPCKPVLCNCSFMDQQHYVNTYTNILRHQARKEHDIIQERLEIDLPALQESVSNSLPDIISRTPRGPRAYRQQLIEDSDSNQSIEFASSSSKLHVDSTGSSQSLSNLAEVTPELEDESSQSLSNIESHISPSAASQISLSQSMLLGLSSTPELSECRPIQPATADNIEGSLDSSPGIQQGSITLLSSPDQLSNDSDIGLESLPLTQYGDLSSPKQQGSPLELIRDKSFGISKPEL